MSPVRLVAHTLALCALIPFAVGCGGSSSGDDDDDDDDDDTVDGSPGDSDAARLDPDAREHDAANLPANFACLGAPLPTTAPANVTLAGIAKTVTTTGQNPVAGITVTAFSSAGATLESDTSDSAGAYSITTASGGVPVDGYAQATGTGYMTTYLYPAAPIADNIDNATALVIDAGTFFAIQVIAGLGGLGDGQQPGNGWIGVIVEDCNGDPVEGATVTTSPAGSAIRYLGPPDGLPVADDTSTDASGLALVFNVPAGNVEVDASFGGHSLREHTVNARPDVNTTTLVMP